MKKSALITGISGQDGSYLSELLLEKGYEVYGVVRRHSVSENQTKRIEHMRDTEHYHLLYGDLTDTTSLIHAIQTANPDEIYNLGAMSHVKISFEEPIYTAQTTGVGALNLFEAARLVKKDVKIYQASSSEMFGNQIDEDGFQRETTPMIPVSPYGCAKVFAHNVAHNYRNAYGMFISSGLLFNHESPRRGSNFVTAKVVKSAVEIKKGLRKTLPLGNLDASRDWSHAKDMVRAMWMILQHHTPDDFVCASGISHTVRELCEYVFSKLDMDYKDYVVLDEKFLRPEELHHLKGDCTKLKTTLGWSPEYTFETLLDEMIEYWMEEIK